MWLLETRPGSSTKWFTVAVSVELFNDSVQNFLTYDYVPELVAVDTKDVVKEKEPIAWAAGAVA